MTQLMTRRATRQLCTMALSDLAFGIDVRNVQEVIRCQPMARVPLAPKVIRGLINLRGQIVTAIDLRAQIGLPERAGEQGPMNVVVQTSDGVVSLLVDEIGDVVEVDETSYERPPETLSGKLLEFVQGVYKLKGRLLLSLDVERAVRVT